jgi:thioredoxin 1
MPTFIIFKSGVVVDTVKGADPRGLASAIDKAVKNAKATKTAFVYSTPGHTLGGGTPRTNLSRGPVNFKRIIDTIVAFFGLYFYSLFALDAYTSAESSPFNIHAVAAPPQPKTGTGTRTGAATKVGKKLGPISDFSGN